MSRQADDGILDRRFGLGSAAAAERHEGRLKALPLREQLRSPEAAMIAEARAPSVAAMFCDLFQYYDDRNAKKEYMAPAPQTGLPSRGVKEKPHEYFYRTEVGLRLDHGIETSHPLLERLVLFWSNHFALSARSHPKVRMLSGHFERTAIRPHILGSFSDMLRQAVRHPAYLTYFNAVVATGPNARDHGKHGKGYNENIGREIMELHTLGDTSLYTTEDIQALSLMLTGWGHTYRKHERPGSFVFRPSFHEPGTQILLGKQYADFGVGQAESALIDLARHPATALHLSRKLIRYFSGNTAREDQARRLAGIYLDNDTGLLPVMQALLDMADEWDAVPQALTSPYEFLVGSLRSVGLGAPDIDRMMRFLKTSGQETWNPPSPKGWPEAALAWLSPEGMRERMEWAAYVASMVPANPSPLELAQNLFGASYDGELRELFDRASSREQALVLILMSPSVQRR